MVFVLKRVRRRCPSWAHSGSLSIQHISGRFSQRLVFSSCGSVRTCVPSGGGLIHGRLLVRGVFKFRLG